MGKRKIKRVKRTFRVDCSDLVYIDEDDEEFFPREGQHVRVRKKTSPRDYEIMLAIAELAGEENDEEPSMGEILNLFESMPDAYAMVARKVVSWNWTDLWSDDDDPPPLPEPTLETVMNLDFETDVMHLIGIVMGEDDSKNAPSPS